MQVDDELEFCRLHHRQVAGLLALENTPDVDTGQPVALPPGRLRLVAKPSLIGSPFVANTIGIV
jgi:hypothetical protein